MIELVEHVEKATEVTADSFDPHRGFERRYPGLVEPLGSWMQGYQRNRQSAVAILGYLEEHFPVNRDLAAAIRELGKGNEEGEFGAGKPDARVDEHALRTLRVSPAEAWMVGDNLEWDVKGAQEVGILGIWRDVAGTGLPSPSPAQPNRIIRSLTDLLPA